MSRVEVGTYLIRVEVRWYLKQLVIMTVFGSGQCVAPVESGSSSLVHNAQLWGAINTGYRGLTLLLISRWYSCNLDLYWTNRKVNPAASACSPRTMLVSVITYQLHCQPLSPRALWHDIRVIQNWNKNPITESPSPGLKEWVRSSSLRPPSLWAGSLSRMAHHLCPRS